MYFCDKNIIPIYTIRNIYLLLCNIYKSHNGKIILNITIKSVRYALKISVINLSQMFIYKHFYSIDVLLL